MNHALPAKTISLASEDYPVNNARLLSVCGERHKHIKIIEEELEVSCYQQGADFVLQGQPERVEVAVKVLNALYAMTKTEKDINDPQVYQVINNLSEPSADTFNQAHVHTPLKQVLAKRPEKGRFSWPKGLAAKDGKLRIKHAALSMLMEGIDLKEGMQKAWYEK